LLHAFNNYITQHQLFLPKDRLLLAVSGGVDSVVLCELCHQAGYTFAIAHCNFTLRGEESKRDEDFTRSLAAKYNTSFFLQAFNTQQVATEQKKSIETTARELRYSWFNELLKQQRAETGNNWYLLTAHHADDNIETVLMNFFRGTGIAGIRGMLPRQEKIIRPLLFARRQEIEAFAKAEQLHFVTDSSNLENEYTRNRFRNSILPEIAAVYPGALNNILNNISRFTETEQLYQQAMTWHKKKLLVQRGTECHIPVIKLQRTTPLHTVVHEIIKEYDFTAPQTAEVIALLQSETGKYVQSPTHRIIKNRKWLIISPVETTAAQHILIEAGEQKIWFAAGMLTIKKQSAENHTILTSPMIAQLDAHQIRFPLLLRKWQQGDYFYPLGMAKKKKLSRFFIDQKLSLTEKENVWVMEMNKKIIWVAGMRIDDRFKIRSATKQVLLIELKKKDAKAV